MACKARPSLVPHLLDVTYCSTPPPSGSPISRHIDVLKYITHSCLSTSASFARKPGSFFSQLYCMVCVLSSYQPSVNCQLLMQPSPTTSVKMTANPSPLPVPFLGFLFLQHTDPPPCVPSIFLISLPRGLSPLPECKLQEDRTFLFCSQLNCSCLEQYICRSSIIMVSRRNDSGFLRVSNRN